MDLQTHLRWIWTYHLSFSGEQLHLLSRAPTMTRPAGGVEGHMGDRAELIDDAAAMWQNISRVAYAQRILASRC